MIPRSARNWIAVNAVQQSQPQQKMKTKTPSNPGPLLRALFTPLLAIAAPAAARVGGLPRLPFLRDKICIQKKPIGA
jgi:hypothetical protein